MELNRKIEEIKKNINVIEYDLPHIRRRELRSKKEADLNMYKDQLDVLQKYAET